MSGHGSPGRLDVEISSLGPGEPGVTGPVGATGLQPRLTGFSRLALATLASSRLVTRASQYYGKRRMPGSLIQLETQGIETQLLFNPTVGLEKLSRT